MIRLAAAALLAATTACASAPRREVAACPGAWTHVEATLRAGLATYEDGLGRYVAAAVPGGDVSAGRARAAAAAERWAASHREGFLAGCRAGAPALPACTLGAGSAADLHGCGLGPLVQSFSDEVLPAFAEDPMGQGTAAPGSPR